VKNVLQAHVAAIHDRLDADDVAPALVVLTGVVAGDPPLPYVLVHYRLWTPSGAVEPSKVSLEKTSDVINVSAYCHCVGRDVNAALAVAGRVRTQLLGWTPTIAGRVCFPVSHEDSVPADPDETTGTDYVDQIDVYAFTSLPAA
jgi:hypothetical protein